MSEDKATKLIQKWFYGKDLHAVAGGDTANPAWGGSTVGTYGTSNGTLLNQILILLMMLIMILLQQKGSW